MSDYANIREILRNYIGQTLVEITQHDEEDLAAGRDSFVELMFENGSTLKFFNTDSEHYKCGFPFMFNDTQARDPEAPFVPDEADAAAHKWLVVETYTEDGTIDHVLPANGKHHFLNEECWCGTSRKMFENGRYCVNHEEEK